MRNAEEIAYWNARAGRHWATWQQQIDVAFAGITASIVAAAGARPGEAGLDVGCGCGTLAFAVARAVGSAGRVVGVDVSEPMLGLAEERAEAGGFGNVSFVRSDAATYAFSAGAFDLAVSRFGVMFFDDPVAAFANIRSALKPGGRMVFACWRTAAENPMFYLPREAVLPLVPAPEPADPLAPGPTAFADPERLRGLLNAAGLRDVRIAPLDVRMPMGSLAESVDFFLHIGPGSRLLEGADAATVVAAGERIGDALRAHVDADAVTLDARVWLVAGSV